MAGSPKSKPSKRAPDRAPRAAAVKTPLPYTGKEFLESLRDADILHKRKSLIYLQSLKFLQTNVRPRARPAARR